jgi:hypothetical protein
MRPVDVPGRRTTRGVDAVALRPVEHVGGVRVVPHDADEHRTQAELREPDGLVRPLPAQHLAPLPDAGGRPDRPGSRRRAG